MLVDVCLKGSEHEGVEPAKRRLSAGALTAAGTLKIGQQSGLRYAVYKNLDGRTVLWHIVDLPGAGQANMYPLVPHRSVFWIRHWMCKPLFLTGLGVNN